MELNERMTLAIENDDLETVKKLIENGYDIHTYNDFILRDSAEYGYLNVVQYLVEHGANIHAENDEAMVI